MPHSAQPHHLPDPQPWAVDQSRQRADGALYRRGEYAAFLLLWRIADFDAGLVDHCHACYLTYGEVADAFGQPAQNRCPTCLGTTFQGGIKHRLIRPSLWSFSAPDDRQDRRGQVETQTANVQSTSDFRLRHGDYVLRADGTRWQAKTAEAATLRTGFDHPSYAASAIGFNYAQVTREETTSVAFLAAPAPADLPALLDPSHPHFPLDFTATEVVAPVPKL